MQAAGGDAAKIDIMALATPPWFVPDTTPLYEQLKAFRRRKTPFALVVDEYGEMEGLVTLEDIIEEIVGDISDEHDIAVPGVRPQPDGSVNVDGAVPMRDLNRAMDWNIPDDEATTIAGVVIHEARSIPEPGQSFTFHGFRFRVLRKSRNRITALRITPLARKVDGEGKLSSSPGVHDMMQANGVEASHGEGYLRDGQGRARHRGQRGHHLGHAQSAGKAQCDEPATAFRHGGRAQRARKRYRRRRCWCSPAPAKPGAPGRT